MIQTNKEPPYSGRTLAGSRTSTLPCDQRPEHPNNIHGIHSNRTGPQEERQGKCLGHSTHHAMLGRESVREQLRRSALHDISRDCAASTR